MKLHILGLCINHATGKYWQIYNKVTREQTAGSAPLRDYLCRNSKDAKNREETNPRSDDNGLESVKHWFNSNRRIEAAEVHYGVGYRRRSVVKRLDDQHKPCRYFTQVNL